jgi:hypothetical protein
MQYSRNIICYSWTLSFGVFCLIGCLSVHGEEPVSRFATPAMPSYRIEKQGFNDSEQDIRRLLDSAGRELWRYFPDHKIEPFVVGHGKENPIVWFQRNDQKEIVMKLNTGSQSWSQYSYQFSHEFCHILSGFDNDFKGNQWFEEMLCEAASLFVIKAMSESWKEDPPYPHWSDYRHALKNYLDENLAKYRDVRPENMAQIYRDNQVNLTKQPKYENLQAKMAVVIFHLLEKNPHYWESIRWLNAKPSPKNQTFKQYLNAWYQAVPKRHQVFVKEVADLYEIEVIN